MRIRQPTILEVIVNESMHEINTMDNTALLVENRIAELLEDMVVVLFVMILSFPINKSKR